VFVIAAIGPEAQANPRGFARAIAAAQQRCAEIEITEEDENEAIQPETT